MIAGTHISIGALLASLGTDVARPGSLPFGTGQAAGPPVIWDSSEPTDGLAGSTVLLTGRPAPVAVHRAAEAGALAVAVKLGDASPALLGDAANSAGIALLFVAEDIPWGRLYTLIDALLAVVGPVGELEAEEAPDLFSLANQLAVRVGGAVAIEDLAMRVIAYSSVEGQEIDELRRSGILERRVPEHPSNADEYAQVLRSSTACWSYQPREYYPRLAIAVRAHGEALGSIWAVQASTALSPDAHEVLAEGARIAAPHLARLNMAADAVRHRRNERLGRLVNGVGPSEELAASLGLAAGEPLVAVAFGAAEVVSDALVAAHVSDKLRGAFATYRMSAAVGSVGDEIFAVVVCDPGSPVLTRVLQSVLAELDDKIGGRWRAGIGRRATHPRDVLTSARQASEALRGLYGPLMELTVGRHEQMSAVLLLQAFESTLRERVSLDAEPLSILADHDARHGSDYVNTLRAWLECNGEVPTASKHLILHPNSLRHRLRRIGELIDLDDPDTRLTVWLQIRLTGNASRR